MELTTKVEFENLPFDINHQYKLVLFGSCFSDNIGRRFKQLKFKTKINPFGIIYNPIIIAQTLNRSINKIYFTEKDIMLHNNQYFTFFNHSKLNSKTQSKHLQKMNEIVDRTFDHLRKADCIFFTFGTAFFYHHIISNLNVANCHKLPNHQFEKKIARLNRVVENFQKCIDQLKALNPTIKILFSLSPVRHFKDGIVANSLSKSILRLSISELVHKNASSYYLPVYELQMDELRDYRFYSEDLIHPNDTALKIIWNRLSDIFFDEKTKKINLQIEKYNRMKNHKIMNKKSEAYLKLKENIRKEKQKLKNSINF